MLQNLVDVLMVPHFLRIKEERTRKTYCESGDILYLGWHNLPKAWKKEKIKKIERRVVQLAERVVHLMLMLVMWDGFPAVNAIIGFTINVQNYLMISVRKMTANVLHVKKKFYFVA